jgi:hypothetical protein
MRRSGANVAATVCRAQPRAASGLASVWFTAYPAAIVTRDGESVLKNAGRSATLGRFVGNRDTRDPHQPMKRPGTGGSRLYADH